MNTRKTILEIKGILILILAVYFTLVLIGNLTDYGTNYAFVENVMKMETTFNSPNTMWRSVNSNIFHHLFYWIIILTEILAAIYLWVGGTRILNKNKNIQSKGRKTSLNGLFVSMVIWFGYFITIGGEWFLMWQSESWNGIDSAFRMFTISAILFIALLHKD
jgi:predicted small integral membrane protein